MSKTVQINGRDVVVDDATFAAEFPGPALSPSGPQTVFAPADLMTVLFTPAEQIGFASKPMGVLFMSLIAAHQVIDITSAEFRTDIGQAVAAGFLTQDRANQVLAGTPAPAGA